MGHAKRWYCHIATLLLVFGLIMLIPPTASAYERPVLRVGYTNAINYLSRDEYGFYHGMTYEALENIATYMGVTLEYVPGTPAENLLRLHSGAIDLVTCEEVSQNFLPPTELTAPPAGTASIPLGYGIGWLLLSDQRPDLKADIQASQQSLNSISPLFGLHLLEKYQDQGGAALELTAEEKAYLKAHPVIRAMASPGQPPYTFFTEDGTHQGVIADIMNIIASDLGTTIEISPETDQSSMMAHLTRGEIDLVTDFYSDYNWARQHNADLTIPYLTLNYVAVLRKDQSLPEKPIIACPRSHFYTHDYMEKMYPASQLQYYDTVAECMSAVNNRQADMTLVKAITAQSDIHQGNYYNLYITGNIVFSHDVAIAVSHQADPMLIHILNKEIAHLSQQQISSIINRQIYAVQSKDTLQSLIYRNPIGSLVLISSLLLGIILTLLLVMQLRRKHSEELYREAHYLKEVNMYNTRWFTQNLPSTLAKYEEQQKQGKLFLMVMSPQRIAFMHELYSRQAFNKALQELVARIRRNNPWLLMDAISGDFFKLIVLCRLPEGFTMEQAAQKIAHEAGTCVINDMLTTVRYHIGLYAIPASGQLVPERLIDCVMLAHMESVASHETTTYNESLHDELLKQKQLENLMDKALQNGEFQVYLQPKYDLQTYEVLGAEALVRWQSPELGFLAPAAFMDLFEHNGFAIPLDYYMLETICRYQQERIAKGATVLPISVNQSGLHFTEENYLKRMQAIADTYQLPQGCLELEITETAFIDYQSHDTRDDAGTIINRLSQLGFILSMDDFCTGYSSIAMLQNLPMDVMKIDRQMLLTAEKSPRARTILHHIVKLGQSLHMKVLTEGIETKQQEELLLSLGCRLGQGFLFAEPMPLEEFDDFLARHTQKS